MVLLQMTSVFKFVMNNMQVAILPLIPAIIIVGGIIICTLSYVSWRKYRAEIEKKQRDNDKMID